MKVIIDWLIDYDNNKGEIKEKRVGFWVCLVVSWMDSMYFGSDVIEVRIGDEHKP